MKKPKEIHQIDKLHAEGLLKCDHYKKLIAEYEDLSPVGEKRTKIGNEHSRIIELLPKRLPKTISPSSKYFKLLQRYRKLQKKDNKLEERRIMLRKEICKKFNLPSPYSLDKLKAIAEGKDIFYESCFKTVDIEEVREYEPEADGEYRYVDEEGFLHFKIKAGAPREEVLYWINVLLNIYDPKKRKERLRIGYINPYEVYFKVKYDKKTLLQIAKELIDASALESYGASPAYNSSLKSTYEQVKRAYNITKKLLK